MNKLIFLFLACLCTVGTLTAQAPITEGSFVYELSNLETEDPQMGQIFAGATITIDTKDEVYRNQTNLMGQQISIEAFNDNKLSENYIYLTIMGRKIATQMSNDEFNTKWQNLNENSIITYKFEDTKEIAGFPCYSAKIETLQADGSISEMNVYLTESISIPNHLTGNFPEKLKGFPLEYSSSDGGANMTFTLVSYTPEVKSDLTSDRNDFKVMPYDEFMNTIGKKMGL